MIGNNAAKDVLKMVEQFCYQPQLFKEDVMIETLKKHELDCHFFAYCLYSFDSCTQVRLSGFLVWGTLRDAVFHAMFSPNVP